MRILIINDNEAAYVITRNLLTKSSEAQWIIDWADSYESGREKLFHNLYHAVLVDEQLGNHLGLDLIREFSQHEYPAPLILLTGQSSDEIDVEAIRAGATLYLPKNEPNPQLLALAIRYAIDIKQRERALRLKEERFKITQDSSPDGYTIFQPRYDADGNLVDFIFVDENAAAGRMNGTQPDQVVGKGLLEIFPGARDTAFFSMYRQAIQTNQPVEFEEHYHGDSVQHDTWFRIVAIPYAGGLTVSAQDITARKLSEQALQKSEARYRGLFTTMQEGFALGEVIFDQSGIPCNFRLLEINDAFIQQTGITRDILGKPITEILPNVETSWIDTYCTVALTGNSADFERYNIDTNRHYHIFCYSPAKGQFAVLFRDISKEKLMEAQLSWIARFPEENPNPVVRGSADGQVLYRNPNAGEAPGWKCQVGQLLPEPLRSLTIQAMQQEQELQRDVRMGDRYYAISIMPFPDENYANLYGRDITERKQIEAALQQSEARFRQLADAMPQLVWTAQADGTVDYYNQRVEEYKGIQQQGSGIWTWNPVLYPEDTQLTIAAWERAVRTGAIYQVEHRILMTDGSYRWHLSRGFPVRDEQGQVIRWFGTATDIHDLKESETILSQYTEKLKRSNQDLEQFAFVASHDLQEPLRKIMSFGSVIQEKLSGKIDAEISDNLKRMINASERMQAMIEDLLELSRVSTKGHPFTMVDLSQVAAEVVSDLEARITRAQAQVIISPLPVIEADPTQLHQLLQNLISNALKFHRPNIPPIVKVSSQTFRAKADRKQMVTIKIEDNGIGFDPQYFQQILQPFIRLHGRNEYEGTGIGLAIVKKIIDRHQGEITAHSTPGGGSTFMVTLPQKQPISA